MFKISNILLSKILLVVLSIVVAVTTVISISIFSKINNSVSAETNNTIYESNFSTSSTAQTIISAGWQEEQLFANGTLYEQDGALILDNGTTYSIGTAGYTEVNSKNYMISADLTMMSRIDGNRWMGVFYRQNDASCLNMFSTSAANKASFDGYYSATYNPNGTLGWYSDNGGTVETVTFPSDLLQKYSLFF